MDLKQYGNPALENNPDSIPNSFDDLKFH